MDPIKEIPGSSSPITGVIGDSFSSFMNNANVPPEYQDYLKSIFDIIQNNGNNTDVSAGGRGSNTGSIPIDISNVFNPALGNSVVNAQVTASANNLANDVLRGEDPNQQEDDSLEDLLKKMIITANTQNQLSYQTAQQVRQFNHDEAELERNWQERMRDTQIESTMKQLKEAGINPLLALSGSLGYANASSGASGSGSNVSFANDNSIISALIVALAGIASSIFRSNSLMKAALAS